ncbi:tripartite tricarboxylate transporter TctB family protein [Aurantimonas marina]|uniref:tripartite tricarboxylate transporter TctB family protein n=1 Tax=Aurantimonas marina TaxID=2780508 RepID=UPI0019CF7CF0|nr:tripartite tricarboxylate transporter TctB family protein [Aurantimonas marina]
MSDPAYEQHQRRGPALMLYGTIGTALILIVVAITMIVVAGSYPKPATLGAPGPARLPIIFGTLLVMLSGGLIARSFLGPREPELTLQGMPRALALAAGTAICIYLWSFLNFLVLFIPATLLGVRLLGTGWTGAIVAAIVIPGSAYTLFGLLLDVPFP